MSAHIKRSITLLEMMITVAILATVGSIIGIRINKAVENHRFEEGVQMLQKQIDYCQRMAMIHNVDLFLILKSSDKGMTYQVLSQEETSNYLEMQKAKSLSSIFLQTQEEVKILFSSRGSVFPEMQFEVISSDKQKHKSFVFHQVFSERKDPQKQIFDAE